MAANDVVDYDPFSTVSPNDTVTVEAVPAGPKANEIVDHDPFDVSVPEAPTFLEEVDQGAFNLGAGFYKGVADTLGMPVDAVNFLANTVGITNTEDAIGGGESIKDFFNFIGLPTNPEEGSIMGKTGEFAGAAVAPQALALKAATAGRAMAGPVSKFFKPVVDYVGKNPLASSLSALGIALPGAATSLKSGDIAAEVAGESYRPTGEAVGALVGSVAPTAALGSARVARNAVNSFYGRGDAAQTKAAAKALEQNMLPSTKQNILNPSETTPQTPTVGNATTGQVHDDPLLMSLTRALETKGSANSAMRGQQRVENQKKAVTASLEKLKANGTPWDQAAAVNVFDQRVATVVNNVERRVKTAVVNSQKAVANATDNTPIEIINKKASNQLEAAASYAKKQEKKVWESTGAGKFNVENVKDRATELIVNLRKFTDPADIPALVYELADVPLTARGNLPESVTSGTSTHNVKKLLETKMNKVESIDGITNLRSRILSDIRKENGVNGNSNRVYFLRQILDPLFNGLTPNTFGGAKVLERVDKARAVSRSMHEMFNEGHIGKIRGITKAGDLKVSPEQVLDKLLSPSKGSIGYTDLLKSMKNIPGGTNAINRSVVNHLKASFASKTLDPVTRQFNPKAAKTFLKQNEKLLNEMPELKASMADAAIAEDLALSVGRTAEQRIARVQNSSVAAKYTKGTPTVQLQSALEGKNPLGDVRQLMRMASKDKSGSATKGLKASFFETMVGRTSKTTDLDTFTSPEKLRDFSTKYKDVITQLYGKEGSDFVKEVVKGAIIGSRDTSSSNMSNLKAIRPEHGKMRQVAGTVGVVMGSKLAQWLGGNQIMIANMGRKVGENAVMQKIVSSERDDIFVMFEDALYDPKLARTLMKKASELTEKEWTTLSRYANRTGLFYAMGEATDDRGLVIDIYNTPTGQRPQPATQ